jgi:hypothetical protein
VHSLCWCCWPIRANLPDMRAKRPMPCRHTPRLVRCSRLAAILSLCSLSLKRSARDYAHTFFACYPTAALARHLRASLKHVHLHHSFRLGSGRVCTGFRLHRFAPAGFRQNTWLCSPPKQPRREADARGVAPRCFFQCQCRGYWPAGPRRKQFSIHLQAG